MSPLASWSCFGALIVLFVGWCLLRMASITEDEMDEEEELMELHEAHQLLTEEVQWREANRPEWREAMDFLLWKHELEETEDAE